MALRGKKPAVDGLMDKSNPNRCAICSRFKKWEELICCDIPYSENKHSYYECISCIYDKHEKKI